MSDFIIKTVSFLSGKVLIGKVKDNGDWEDALFITVTQHPETGERRASFRPVAPGRAHQGMTREEYLMLTNGQAFIGPSLAAHGLAEAYMDFVKDEEAVRRCVCVHTQECGPSDAFVGKLDDCPCPAKVESDGNLTKITFKKEPGKLE